MYVTDLATAPGIAPDTLRYYTKIGLLKPARDPENRYHVFNTSDGDRLKFIRAAKGLGYTLSDIRKIFADANSDQSACPRARALIEKHLKETDERLAELTALRERMASALSAWEKLPDSQPTSESVCALIESLSDVKA